MTIEVETPSAAGRRRPSAATVVLSVGLVLALALAGVAWSQQHKLSQTTAEQADTARKAQAAQQAQIASLAGQLSAATAQLKAQQTRLTADEKKLDLTTQALPPDVVALAGRVTPSVVEVICATATTVSTGTGFALALTAADGYKTTIVTAEHVVHDCVSAGALGLQRGTATLPVVLRAADHANDVAILDTTAALPPLSPAPAPVVGQFVMAVGNPLGLDTNVTTGNVSQVHTQEFLHSAPASSGNSGGPLVDRSGRVLGIDDASYVPTDGTDIIENLNIALRLTALCATLLSGPSCDALH